MMTLVHLDDIQLMTPLRKRVTLLLTLCTLLMSACSDNNTEKDGTLANTHQKRTLEFHGLHFLTDLNDSPLLF